MQTKHASKRLLSLMLVLIMALGMIPFTALAAPFPDVDGEDEGATSYEIEINEPGVQHSTSVFNKWLISGAEAVVCEITTVRDAGQEHWDRTFDIQLAYGTDPDAAIKIDFDITEQRTTLVVSKVTGTNQAVAQSWMECSEGIYVNLDDGQATETLYIYYTAPAYSNVVYTTNIFNFSIAPPDTTTDPDPDEVDSITITTPPRKTTYFEGDQFSTTSMVVTATLKEGGETPVLGYTVTPEILSRSDTEVVISFGSHTARQPVTVLPSLSIGDVQITNGQFLPDYEWSIGSLIKQKNTHNAVLLPGETNGIFTFHVGKDVEVLIDEDSQPVDDDGLCTLTLPASVGGTATVVTIKASAAQTDYTFKCYSRAMSGLPTAVVDYLCIASQYTNGGGLGPYGVNGVATLRGTGAGTVSSDPHRSPTSLGNFGGYITYYYEDAIMDDPRNPYGADFLISGNSVENSNAFAEPGNVLVSHDGETWYTLAGSLHYDDNALWDYTITYKNNNGQADWTDNLGKSGTSYWYPRKEFYPLFSWTEGLEHEMTITGVALVPGDEVNEFGNTMPPFPDFGYVDVGSIFDGNTNANPYKGTRYNASSKRIFRDGVDTFDLKWAVDEDGQPVELPDGIHYIKVQTANNVDNGGIGEKSTEVNLVRVAVPSSSAVGVTGAPASITVDGKTVSYTGPNLEVVDDVEVSGAFIVNVETSAANVYINGSRGKSATFAKTPNHEMLRVIVQEGEKEPWIGYFNLIEGERDEDDKYTVVTFDSTGGSMAGAAERTYLPEMPESDKVFPIPEWTNRTFLGWYDADGNKYESYSPDMPRALTLTARWQYILGEGESSTIRVSFRLIGATPSNGDINLGAPEGYKGSRYVTWVPTRTYTMNKGDTMYELFTKAIKDAGLAQRGAERNYVSAIKAPSVHGGHWLSEFTNGQRSGWMYTVGKTNSAKDQKHPDRGLLEYDLQDGDVVIWHYVNDYAYEVADWFDDVDFPALHGGDDTFWSRWLDAPDVRPTADNAPKQDDGQQVIIAPKVTASNGTAVAIVSTSDMNKAIGEAKADDSDAIVIEPEISGKAAKITVEVPKASLSAMASDTDADLKVVTPEGSVTIPNGTLADLVSQAEGSTITIVVESVEKKNLDDEQQKLVGDNPVFDISILSGGKNISSFGGKAITISLPYTLKAGETAGGVAVWHLSDDGKLELITCKYDAKTGLATFTTTHLSYYLVGYDAWTNPFSDVKDTDWFYDAVKYALQNELFAGTSASAFSPNVSMTRAMLVTVLHRLDGKPAVAAANSFSDVAAGQWYTDAVVWANTNDIVSGYGNGRFGTNDPITREQMAAILYRYAEYKGYDVAKAAELTKFTDAASVSPWADSAMKWAVAEGLISGMTDTTLAPVGSATRAQVASILMRFAENVTE